ncbi:hypothetical protein CAEBREN_13755 [Caenorhabditis brenneri]|uniref:Uncharacterized protein n=1 Tax=Caenorhabditis brenneri TaxID=135651 RepID=G0PB88_CAEBE|nr:hypothetical protein CAEBREN_13755 [Caenorhabditis brenneri]
MKRAFDRWCEGQIANDDHGFLQQRLIVSTDDVHDDIARFWLQKEWDANDVTTKKEDAAEINDLILHPSGFYCAASRVQTGDGLFVTSLHPDPTTSVIWADRTVVDQIQEWKDMADTELLF